MASVFNDVLDDVTADVRQEEFRGGADTFTPPTLLASNAAQILENALVTDAGRVQTRYGTEALGGAVIADALKVQGLAWFSVPAFEALLAAHNGGLWAWAADAWTAITGYTFDAGLRVALAAGADKVYISDGAGVWYTTDGATATALGSTTGAAGDPPVGATLLCWHQRRMFAAGVATAPDTLWVSDIGDAGNGKWNHTDKSLRVGFGDSDAIVALAPLQKSWLAVLNQGSIHLVNADPAATTAADWQIEHFRGVGCVGPRAAVQVGNDVLFIARDGVRSIRRSVATEESFIVTAPLSQRLQSIFARLNESAADTCVAWSYRHLAFFAIPLDSATAPDTLLVWNVRLGCWIGWWTGFTVREMAAMRFDGIERLVFGTDDGRALRWLDDGSALAAETWQDDGEDIAMTARSRGWHFDAPANPKDGSFCEVTFYDSSVATVRAIYDGAIAKERTASVEAVSNQLPVNLPFDLASSKPVPFLMALDAAGTFREAAIEVYSPSGFIQFGPMNLTAFLNTAETGGAMIEWRAPEPPAASGITPAAPGGGSPFEGDSVGDLQPLTSDEISDSDTWKKDGSGDIYPVGDDLTPST